MGFESFWPLAAFAVISTITPGGATTLATASGAHFGFRRSVPLIAGIALGLASMAAATSLGLAGVLLAAPSLQLAMKTIGSIYLIWLALRIGLSGAPNLSSGLAKPTSLIGGAWMLWHNPKGWAMTLSAAASFAALASGPGQMAGLLGVTFGIAATVSLVIWCLAGLLLARILRTDRQWRVLNMTLGVLVVGSVVPMWL
jgi:threonine/homoserine/homoserine lactone efflux protein